MDTLPLRGRPDEALSKLTAFVDDIAGTPPVTAFAFGRTRRFWKAQAAHGCSYVFALYVTDEDPAAAQVVASLQESYRGHPRFRDAASPEADVPAGDPWYVYVAIWTSASRESAPPRPLDRGAF
jgi:hypothetical protein